MPQPEDSSSASFSNCFFQADHLRRFCFSFFETSILAGGILVSRDNFFTIFFLFIFGRGMNPLPKRKKKAPEGAFLCRAILRVFA